MRLNGVFYGFVGFALQYNTRINSKGAEKWVTDA